MIIDAHAHIFPEKIAVKASHSISDFYEFPYRAPASVSQLLQDGSAAGVTHFLVCSVAVTPEQTTHINDFLMREAANHSEFTALAALHPDYADYEGELDRIVAGGMHGIKLHSDFQKFYLDDPRHFDFFRAIAKRELPVLLHMGDPRYDFSAPARLAALLRAVPDLIVTAAHFGGYERWHEVKCLPKCENVYFDTSSALPFMDSALAVDLIDHFGADRFLFGTDFPITSTADELKRFYDLKLSESENQMILCENFKKLYKTSNAAQDTSRIF